MNVAIDAGTQFASATITDPLQTLAWSVTLPSMRCYYVLVHGSLDWLPERSSRGEFGATRPAGFYCHRYVLSSTKAGAIETAFRRVRENIDRETGWLRDGLATLEFEAEEVHTAPMHKLLKPDNRGHTFYTNE